MAKHSSLNILVPLTNADLPESHLFAGLSQRGHKFTFFGMPTGRPLEVLQRAGISLIEHNFRSRVSLGAIKKLHALLKSGNFDLIHTLSSRALSNTVLANFSTKVPHITYRGTVGGLSRLDPSSLLTYRYLGLARIICVCKAVEESLVEFGISRDRLKTIYKGHAPEWYDLPALSLSQFNIPKDALVVVCAANIRPKKGVDILLRAVPLVKSARPVHYLLVGEIGDPQVQALLQQPNIAERVHAIGYRKEVTQIVRACDLLVMPSVKREGLPKTVIEGMIQGVPAIVSNCGGMPEIVQDQESGLVVPPGDVEALGAALSRVISDDSFRRKLGEGARNRILSDFSIETTILQTEATYFDVLN